LTALFLASSMAAASVPVRTVTISGTKAIQSSQFSVPETWEPIQHLGTGGYAVVAAFRLPPGGANGSDGEICAVKKVRGVLSHPILALRTLREIRILAHLRHPNVLSIQEVFLDGPDFQDVYLRLELLDGDLQHLIYATKGGMTDYQVQCVVYQIMRGMLCLHTARVVHRDLKPGNILVRSDGAVKVADFGLARAIDAEGDDADSDSMLTEYVVTRWYRAPEVVLTAMNYTYAVDIWSLGCIFAEMLTRRILFQGKDSLDQIRKIVSVRGPSFEDLSWIPASSASQQFVANLLKQEGHGEAFRQLIKLQGLNPLALEVLALMLQFDPSKRISIEGCLRHAYLGAFGAEGDSDVALARAMSPVDWSFDLELRRLPVSGAGAASGPGAQPFRAALMRAREMVARGPEKRKKQPPSSPDGRTRSQGGSEGDSSSAGGSPMTYAAPIAAASGSPSKRENIARKEAERLRLGAPTRSPGASQR